jgi:hypothetical protein
MAGSLLSHEPGCALDERIRVATEGVINTSQHQPQSHPFKSKDDR